MKVGYSLHQRQEVDALDFGGSLDRRNEPMEKGTELGAFGWRHLTEIQQMPPSHDDDRSRAGRLQWGVLDEEVLTFDDVATRPGGVQKLRPRFQAVLLPADVAVRPGGNREADRSPQSLRCLRALRGR
jgi:hypothetical protein